MDEQERLMYLGWAKTDKFKLKVKKAQDVIRQGLEIDKSYVSISWGKDSLVLLHLCQQVNPGVLAINVATPAQDLLGNYTETAERYRAKFPTNYEVVDISLEKTIPIAMKELRLWELYPVAFVGLRAEESVGRRQSLKSHGLIHQYKDRGYRVCPLAWWTALDVWSYLVSRDIPWLVNYDLEENREKTRTTNVMSYRGGGTLSQRLGKIERIKRLYPEARRFIEENYPWVLT